MKQKYLSIAAFLVMISFMAAPHFASADSLKIGFITDWEYGTHDTEQKLCTKTKEYLTKAVKDLNAKSPRIVIGGGDYIEGTALTTKTAEAQLSAVNKIFKKIKAPKRYYLTGNHDLRSLTDDEVKSTLGIDYFHKKIDTKGFRILLLDTNFQDDGGHRSHETYMEGNVSDDELDWLKDNIKTSHYPVIIFTHHSPIRPNDRRDIKNSDEVRQAIEESGKVVAVISGHNPTQLRQTENGVRYIVVNNLVNEKARKTYAYIKLSKSRGVVKFSLKQYGTVRRSYTFSKKVQS